LGTFILMKITPVMLLTVREFGVMNMPLETTLHQLVRTVSWWGPLVPLVFGGFLLWVCYRSGRVSAGVELHPLFSFGALGTLSRLQRACRYASLTDLLALLIASDVPMPQAVELASAAVGSPRLAAGGKRLAESLLRGQPLQASPPGFPPLLAWMI